MIITRDIINKQLRFHDIVTHNGQLGIQSYNYDQLSRLVDGYKNLFVSLGSQPGHKAIIGEKLALRQVALVLACAELGINITIVNNADGPAPDTKSIEVELLGPFNYLVIHSEITHSPKLKTLKTESEHYIITDEDALDYTPNNTILSTPDTTFLSCVTSGPKKHAQAIALNHEFIGNLIKRNSKMFYGKVATMSNLNHGSSPAAYFLPTLLSAEVTDFYHFPTSLMRGGGRPNAAVQETNETPGVDVIFDFLNKQDIIINHLNFPYNQFIDTFLSKNPKIEHCVLYTFAYIKEEYVQAVKNNIIKDMISLYGISEVSGPILINRASDPDFSERTYKKLDDFYDISLTDQGVLQVAVPYYNTVVSTGDVFEKITDNAYEFVGKKYMPRINDLFVDFDRYYHALDKLYHTDARIILDNVKNSIYIAFWNNITTDQIQEFDTLMRENSGNLHFINKYDFLNKNDYLETNDHRLIEYFRNKN